MKELILDKALYDNVVLWMQPKYALGTIYNRKVFLQKIFKEYKALNHESIKRMMSKFKFQHQRACLTMLNSYCFDNDIDFYIKIPSIKKKSTPIPNILSESEIKLMIKVAPKPYDLAIRCLFNMGAGLRISEIIKFSWDNIGWVDWLTNQDNYGIAIIKSGKGSKDRMQNIPKKLMKDLYTYAIEQGKINEFRIPTGGMVFPFGSDIETDKQIRKRNKTFAYDVELGKHEYLKSKYDWFRYNILQQKCEKALNKKIKVHSLRHCVSEDTEILTMEGWKKYNKLHKGDVIYNYDIVSNSLKEDIISNIYIYNFSGKLTHLNNSYLDHMITNNHKVVVREIKSNKKTNGWELKKFNNINLKTWNLHYKLSSKLELTQCTIGMEKAGILGWILSDGTINKRKIPSISISQSYSSNKDKCDYIENLLIKGNQDYTKKLTYKKRNNYTDKPYTMCNFQILKGGNHSVGNIGIGHDWIFRYINKDRTPLLKNILSLSCIELEEIYKCMMMGDGTLPKQYPGHREYTGQDSKRIELLRILCLLVGHRTRQGWKTQNGKKYSRLYISENRTYTQLLEKHISEENYNGIIWCPETSHGTFICKRNDKIFITGNSRATYLYEVEHVPIEQIQILLGHSSINTTMIYTKINPISVFDRIKEIKEI